MPQVTLPQYEDQSLFVFKGQRDSQTRMIDQVALVLSQPLVLPGVCQPAKSWCRNTLSAHHPGWRRGPAGFGEGQGTGPAKTRGHKEEIKKKNPGELHQNSAESKTLAVD